MGSEMCIRDRRTTGCRADGSSEFEETTASTAEATTTKKARLQSSPASRAAAAADFNGASFLPARHSSSDDPVCTSNCITSSALFAVAETSRECVVSPCRVRLSRISRENDHSSAVYQRPSTSSQPLDTAVCFISLFANVFFLVYKIGCVAQLWNVGLLPVNFPCPTFDLQLIDG